MFSRARIGLLALSLLLPSSLIAAPHRRGGVLSGGGFWHGHSGGGFRIGGLGRGLTHFGGYGHIRHGGFGFGFGFGFHKGHVRSPLVIRPFYRQRPLIYGYPYGFGYPYAYYYPYVYPYVGGVTTIGVPVVTGVAPGPATSPTVIILQEEPQRPQAPMEAHQPLYQPRPTVRPKPEAGQEVGRRSEPRPAPEPTEPVQPHTLLAFKDRSIYSVTEYWTTGDQLCYLTSLGSGKCVGLDQLDLAFTKKLNAEQNLKFNLK